MAAAAAAVHAIKQKRVSADAVRLSKQRLSTEIEAGSVEHQVLTDHLVTSGTAPGTDERPTGWRTYQPHAAAFYNHYYCQIGVACLIGANFFINVIQAQIDPTGLLYAGVFDASELLFNILFLIELIINMYAHWLCDFWRSSWNVFDFIVVTIGWLFQFDAPLPGPMKLLRMMRAFRVFRLFKRIESLRKIMQSLTRAIPGMMNAFLIQLIVMCIYAIIAVDQFHRHGIGGQFVNEQGATVSYETARKLDYGFEYFGTFTRALYTMFQCLTAESWSEGVARPLYMSNDGTLAVFTAFFFVSFNILCGFVLVNVVVAVLLEKMVDEPPPPGPEEMESDDVTCVDDCAKLEPSQEIESMKADIEVMKKQLMDMYAVVFNTETKGNDATTDDISTKRASRKGSKRGSKLSKRPSTTMDETP
eukprot:TRINITY_DN22145_c0_g1_i1.p1 TRINITY_DN22145_c0_g1~~TRINITY_DN22145_c0_g1_i1.p1  ORF type:complete len:418 (-),score=47.22 TRINITY_DN22145_c0_g1_i1:181-1434(-)